MSARFRTASTLLTVTDAIAAFAFITSALSCSLIRSADTLSVNSRVPPTITIFLRTSPRLVASSMSDSMSTKVAPDFFTILIECPLVVVSVCTSRSKLFPTTSVVPASFVRDMSA